MAEAHPLLLWFTNTSGGPQAGGSAPLDICHLEQEPSL